MLELYSRGLVRIAFLQNAYSVKPTDKLNGVGSLEFRMPSDDPKLPLVEQMAFVRHVDENSGKKSDYYRIVEEPSRGGTGDNEEVQFYCEHGLITLIDKVLFGSYTMGGTGVNTRQVLEWILAKQNPVMWQLGDCDFTRYFEYSWSQENLLSAIFSVPNVFTQPYRFTFDMNTTPWTINLKLFDEQAAPTYYVTKRLNQLKVVTSTDSKQLATRIYALGFGEGANQLTIKEANGGVPYLQAPPAIIEKYGIIEKVAVDRRFQSAETLKEYARNLLEQYMNPYAEYDIKVTDLYLAGGVVDKTPKAGDIIYVADGDIRLYATEISTHPDNEGETVVRVANKSRNVSSTMATLSDRQRIEQVYSQGATNIFSYSFRDNADAEHGLVESFYIPREAIIINSVQFKYQLRPFRSYEKAVQQAAKVVRSTGAGGGSTRTSSTTAKVEVSTMNGGGGTVTSRNGGALNKSTDDGGAISSDIIKPSTVLYTTTQNNDDTAAGGTGDTGGSSNPSTGVRLAFDTGYSGTGETGENGKFNSAVANVTNTGTSGPGTTQHAGHSHNVTGSTTTSNGSHGHTVNSHSHSLNSHYHSVGGHTHKGPSHLHSVPQHNHTMAHTHKGPSHTHGMAHSHSIPAHIHAIVIPAHSHTFNASAHTHNVELDPHAHAVEVPAHSHTVVLEDHTHEIEVPAHSHNLEHGIYENGIGGNSVIVKVDGVVIPLTETNGELDISGYLSVDGGGKINRGIYHSVEIIPNTLSGIVGSVTVQLFIQSKGGDY